MRQSIRDRAITVIAAVLPLLLSARIAHGQVTKPGGGVIPPTKLGSGGGGGGTGTVTSITAGAGLSGGTITVSGTIAVNLTTTTCSAGQTVTAISALGVGTCSTFFNTAGTGLSASGSTVNVNLTTTTCSAGQAETATAAAGTSTCSTFFNTAGTGLSASGSTVNVNLTTTSCSAGQAETATAANGTSTCSAVVTSMAGSASGGLSCSTSSGAATCGLLTSCTAGQYLAYVSSAWTCTSPVASNLPIYGDGYDGAVHYTTNTTLSRNVYATTVLVDTGIVVTTAGFAIYANTSITLTGTAKIDWSGAAASGSSRGQGAAVVVLSGATMAPGENGGSGASGGSGGGGAGSGAASTNAYVGMSGTGGAGGSGDTTAGFSDGGTTGPKLGGTDTVSIETSLHHLGAVMVQTDQHFQHVAQITGGAGGGGGGQTWSGGTSGANGGGGGGGGGEILVASPLITGSGSITSKGGAAAAGGNGTHGGGGGGGGQGGYIEIITPAANSIPYTVSVAGGAGGAAGTGGGLATAGTAGSSGYTRTYDPTLTGVGGGGGVTSVTCSTGLSCTASNPITATGTIALNITTTSCSAGSFISAIASDGTGTCAVAVTTAGTSLSLSGSTLNVNLPGGTCTNGQVAGALNAAGTVTCVDPHTNDYGSKHLEWVDEFTSQPGANLVPFGSFWTSAVSGTGATWGATAAGARPGLALCKSGTTTTGLCALESGNTSVGNLTFTAFGSNTLSEFDFIGGTQTLSTATDEYEWVIGFTPGTLNVNPANGCYFLYDRGNVATGGQNASNTAALECACVNASTRTVYLINGSGNSDESFALGTVTVGVVTLPNTNILNLKILLTGTTRAEFFSGGTKVCDINTNLPTTNLVGGQVMALKSAGTTSVSTMLIDRTRIAIDLSSARSP